MLPGLLLILSLSIGCVGDTRGPASADWEQFLKAPSERSLAPLARCLATSPCHQGVQDGATLKQRARLFDLVRRGNGSAFRAALLAVACWDGGELEDFDRSAGTYFEGSPRRFLRIVAQQGVSEPQLRDMLAMLPLDTVDDVPRKLRILDNRIHLLRRSRAPGVERVADTGLRFLETARQDLERVMNDLKGH